MRQCTSTPLLNATKKQNCHIQTSSPNCSSLRTQNKILPRANQSPKHNLDADEEHVYWCALTCTTVHFCLVQCTDELLWVNWAAQHKSSWQWHVYMCTALSMSKGRLLNYFDKMACTSEGVQHCFWIGIQAKQKNNLKRNGSASNRVSPTSIQPETRTFCLKSISATWQMAVAINAKQIKCKQQRTQPSTNYWTMRPALGREGTTRRCIALEYTPEFSRTFALDVRGPFFGRLYLWAFNPNTSRSTTTATRHAKQTQSSLSQLGGAVAWAKTTI